MTSRVDPADIPPAPDLSWERALWAQGFTHVAGVDEAGRGALAGPVCAASVILPPVMDAPLPLEGVRDSKKMTPAQRAHWAARIREVALAWGVAFASAAEIDALGIIPATRLAVRRALAALTHPPDALLLDYLLLPEIGIPQTSLIKGDSRSLSIAAASVLAKTARDALMIEMDAQYPGYGFARHKGYGTPGHRQALARLGPSPLHRTTFRWRSADKG
ncbi:MAG: ribonuclease HII [Anaerolineae bacterium]|nr:MAG: ribonuclease HII [Anaerolineae bacterium]